MGGEEYDEAGAAGYKPTGDMISKFGSLISPLVGDPYMIPCKNVAVSATLADASMFRFQMTGIGIANITAPVTTFGMAIYWAFSNPFMHEPPAIVLSHA